MTMVKGSVSVWLLASLTITLTWNVPAAVGMPDSRPVVGARVRPAGRLLPAAAAHVQLKGVVPPVAVSDLLYTSWTSPGSRLAVAMLGGGTTVMVNDSVSLLLLVSVTLTVNVNGPGVVGVPVSTPADERLRPGGSPSLGSDHVNGAMPPVRASVVCV